MPDEITDCPQCGCQWNLAPCDDDGEPIGYRCPQCAPPACPFCNHPTPGFINGDWELLWLCPACDEIFNEREAGL